jgi:hypothetical protein
MEIAAKPESPIVKNINGVIKSHVELWSGKIPTYLN